MSLFPVAVITLYWKHAIGLGMEEILLLQGFFGLSMAVFEFPSGYVADRIGYRRTLIAASAVAAVAWAVYAAADTFAEVLFGEVLLGLGMALVSGCDSALLYESLHAVDDEDGFTRWTGRVRFFGQAAEGTAALTAGVLYAWWPRLPFLLEVAVWVSNAAVAWALVEPRRHVVEGRRHLEGIVGIVRGAFVADRRLTSVFVVAVVFGLASFLPVWLVPLYAEGAGVPVVWIGPLWAVANYTVAVGSLASDPGRRRIGLGGLLVAATALIAIGYLGLGLTHAWYGFAFYFCLTTLRGFVGPALAHQEHRLIPSSDRAGFLSLRSLIFRLSFLAVAPIVGAAIDDHGQHLVLLWVGLVLVVLATISLGWARRVGALGGLD